MVLQLAFVSPLYLSLAAQRRSGSSLELESNTMKETENRGLDFRGKAEERERDVDGEMEEKDEVNQIEGHLTAALMLIENCKASIGTSSGMASGRERDVDGEMEEKDEVNQIEEHLKAALRLIENCKASIGTSSAMASVGTQIQAPESDEKNLQLRFLSSLPDIFYTRDKAGGPLAPAIFVTLIDKSTGRVVTVGPVSRAKLNVVAVEGDFFHEDNDDWTREDFKNHLVTDRDGKKLLTGNLELSLEEGVGSLGELTFTDNSSWMQNKKIRLGVGVAPGSCVGIRVREAISNDFVVQDRRRKCYEKHALPAPDDEVWRLRTIAKDGPFHKKLNKAGIFTVRDFLWKLKLSCQQLREILGTGMFEGKWKTLVEHAETCDLSGKYYVYYADDTKSSGVVFENIFEFRWLIEGGEYYSAENLSDSQKEFVDTLKRNAWDNFKRTVKYDGLMPSSMNPSKRARSSQTDRVTGVPAPSRAPAVGGDGPATSSDPSEQAHESTDMAYEDPTFDSTEDLGGLPCPGPSEQADGTRDLSLEYSPDHSKLADGTNEVSVEDYYDGLMLTDMNLSERERFPPTWASENFGIDQQDSTLFGTPVAYGDQVLVNQRLDVGGEHVSDGHVREDTDVDMEETEKEVDSWLLLQPDSPEQADGTDDLSLECDPDAEAILEDPEPREEDDVRE